ncbi:MAG: tripartite tricarboxylate transporter permease, partial [Oscillospiraceae bacterium]|nr:tripartite tricarboxylate transporter permease [Oscillospiraceae bacterium]
ITYSLSPAAGILMLIGVYSGGNYGGAITATLINIPGTPSAVMTTLDAYPMAKQGHAGLAIGIATLASVTGGLFSAVILALLAPMVAGIALRFTSLEMMSIAIFGLSIMAYITPGSSTKGLLAGVIGLLITTIGLDPMTAVHRFTFGRIELLSGLQFVPAMIGLFGLSEVFLAMEGRNKVTEKPKFFPVKNPFLAFTRPYLKRLGGALMRSSIVGTIIGVIPGAGGTIASIVAYAQEKKVNKNRENFGKGAPEGVAAAEAATNACIGGALLVLLAIGIPGDAVTAIILGAFVVHGLTPGPMLFTTNMDLVSAIFIGLVVIKLLIIVLGAFCAKYFARALLIPKPILNTTILVLCVLGSYAVQNSMFDVWTMVIFAVLGYLMNKISFPKPPIVLAMVLGVLFENNFRRWVHLSDGDIVGSLIGSWSANPISLVILTITAITLILPFFQKSKLTDASATQFKATGAAEGEAKPKEETKTEEEENK